MFPLIYGLLYIADSFFIILFYRYVLAPKDSDEEKMLDGRLLASPEESNEDNNDGDKINGDNSPTPNSDGVEEEDEEKAPN